MSLRPGKKYLIKATKEKIAKRDQSNKGSVQGLPRFQYYDPKIDYVQDATADDIEPTYPASQFSTEYFEGGQGGGKYDHGGIPFFWGE